MESQITNDKSCPVEPPPIWHSTNEKTGKPETRTNNRCAWVYVAILMGSCSTSILTIRLRSVRPAVYKGTIRKITNAPPSTP